MTRKQALRVKAEVYRELAREFNLPAPDLSDRELNRWFKEANNGSADTNR